MNSIVLGAAGFMLWVLLYELRGIADNLRRTSDELNNMKATINQIKEAVGDNAFESMLSKPIPKTDHFGNLYTDTNKTSNEL